MFTMDYGWDESQRVLFKEANGLLVMVVVTCFHCTNEYPVVCIAKKAKRPVSRSPQNAISGKERWSCRRDAALWSLGDSLSASLGTLGFQRANDDQ